MIGTNDKNTITLKSLLRPEGYMLLLAFTLMPMLSGFLIYQESKKDIHDELLDLCTYTKAKVDASKHTLLTRMREDGGNIKQELLQKLSEVHTSNPKIKYIYTLYTENTKDWFFVLDTLQDDDTHAIIKKRFPDAEASSFMERYDYPEQFIEDYANLQIVGHHLDNDVFTDEYGTTIGCIVPLSSDGRNQELLGIDYNASEINSLKTGIWKGVLIGLFVGMIFYVLSLRYVGIHFSKNRKTIKKLNYISNVDSLTEISNRRFFFSSAEKLAANMNPAIVLAVAVLDIDFFKRINDTHGHQAGDAALIHFAKLLNHTCNTRKFIIGRIGGEEFGVCCATDDQDDIVRALTDLQSLLKKSPVMFNDKEIYLTFSAGYAITLDESQNVNDLLALADEALYESKETGRDRITLYKKFGV